MEWYHYLLCTSGFFLLLQLIMSLIFGDFDIDHDFDLGDVISFKGGIHFVLGFSLVLVVFGKTTFFTISLAIFVGLIFLIGLYWLYRFLYTKLGKVINCESAA